MRQDETAEREAKQTEIKRQGLTFGDVWPEYLSANKSKWSERHYRNHEMLSAKGGEVRSGAGNWQRHLPTRTIRR